MDIYNALHALESLASNGYLQLFHSLLDEKYPFVLTESIEAVVLQLQKSDRWNKDYGVAQEQYDIVLAVPKWARVVSLSTSEIQPFEMINQIKQFDGISLENYHLYEFFNKLHGVTSRSVKITSKYDIDRAKNFTKLNFLLRNLSDIKQIVQSKNIRLFTTAQDLNGIPRITFYFAVFCKILDVKDVKTDDGTGFNPYVSELVCSDGFDSLSMRIDASIFNHSIKKGYLEREFNELFGSNVNSKAKFAYPGDLKNSSGDFLIVGNCFLGDELPNISYLLHIDQSADLSKYHLVEYTNTRKKLKIDSIERRFQKKLSEITGWEENLLKDKSGQWCYYKESHWDQEILTYVLEKNFKDYEFREVINRGISFNKFNLWKKYTSTYFRINAYIIKLYLSNDPSKEFEKVYEKWDTVSTVNNNLKYKNQELKISFQRVRNWSELILLVPRLKKSGYSINDIFSWDNGERVLMRQWLDRRLYNHRIDEFHSVLWFILQSRGLVNLPDNLL